MHKALANDWYVRKFEGNTKMSFMISNKQLLSTIKYGKESKNY